MQVTMSPVSLYLHYIYSRNQNKHLSTPVKGKFTTLKYDIFKTDELPYDVCHNN